MCGHHATELMKQAIVFHMGEYWAASSLTFMGPGLKGIDNNKSLNMDGWKMG